MEFENEMSAETAVVNEVVETVADTTPVESGGDDGDKAKPYEFEAKDGEAKEGDKPVEKKEEKKAKISLKDLRKLSEDAQKEPGKTDDKAAGEKADGSVAAGEAPKTGFAPKLSVNIRNKEVAIPEKFKGLMTDEKSQKEIHELFEKSYGLDVIKPKHQELIKKFEETDRNLNMVVSSVNAAKEDYQGAMNHLKSGKTVEAMHSLDNFFQKLNVPEEVVLRYALEKAKFHELPPEQQQIIQDRKAAESKAQNFETTAKTTEQSLVEAQSKLLDMELGQTLASSDVKSVADFYDGLDGHEPGAFREMVIEYGIQQHNNGKHVSPAEAAQAVIKKFGLANLAKVGTGSTKAGPQSATSAQEEVVEETEESEPPKLVKKKVVASSTIPNVGSKGNSPAKSRPTNLKQLRELSQKFSE